MARPIFTAEELAELAAFDAMVDAEPVTLAERKESRERDLKIRQRNENREAIAEYKKQYYAENREAIAEYQKQYRAENREAIAEYQKQYCAENREAIAEYKKQYRAENREAIAEYQKQYYAENREAIAEYQKQYRAERRVRTWTPLKHWRKDHGMSQRELAKLLGVSQQTISNWELGIGTPAEILRMISPETEDTDCYSPCGVSQ